MSVVQPQRTAVSPRFVGGVAQHQRLLRRRRQILAPVGDAIGPVLNTVDRRVDIEPPFVGLWRAMRQVEPQVAQVLVTSRILLVAGP